MTMKLCQGQLWKQGPAYIRIVRLERLAVEYKSMPHPTSKDATTVHATKKEFCRLLKGAQLLNDKLTGGAAKEPMSVTAS